MAKLPSLTCPKCGKLIESEDYEPQKNGGAPRAKGFDNCLRRCEKCGIGFSNAKKVSSVKKIYRDILDNIPIEVQGDLQYTLENALNAVNREGKKKNFRSVSSEDAITWTVFSYLKKANCLLEPLKALDVDWVNLANREPSLLLWGVPVPKDDHKGLDTRKKLKSILKQIGEVARGYSEPDVILDFGIHGIVFIEVKFLYGNTIQKNGKHKWDKYLSDTDAFLDSKKVISTKYYELARNWRIAWELATSRPMVLVNLGKNFLFERINGEILEKFCSCLRQDNSHLFKPLSWSEFLKAVPQKPNWFVKYISEKNLIK